MRSDIEPEPEFHGEIYPSASGHGRVCTTGSGIDRNVGFIAPPSVWKSTTRMKTRSWMHQSFVLARTLPAKKGDPGKCSGTLSRRPFF